MQFIFFVCHEEPFTPPEELQPDVRAWVDETTRSGKRLTGDRLRPPEEARTLRVRDGRMVIQDGPFAQTKVKIGGYDLVECENMDEAVAMAAQHPMAKLGTIEVRQVWKP